MHSAIEESKNNLKSEVEEISKAEGEIADEDIIDDSFDKQFSRQWPMSIEKSQKFLLNHQFFV